MLFVVGCCFSELVFEGYQAALAVCCCWCFFSELVLVSEGYQAALAAVVVLAVFSELVSEGYQTALAVCCSGCCCFQSWSWCLRAIRQLLLFVDVAVVVSELILVSEGYQAALAVC